MGNVQNSCIYNKSVLEPALFLGAALLAGRFVQHFPNTSQSGLLLSAGLASVGTCIYNNTLHDDNHALLTTMLGKAVIIAAANFGASHLAKSLNEKGYAFSLESALKMGGVQFVASTLISAVCSGETEKTIQEKHYEYRTDKRKWQRLTYEERTELVKEFIKADLPYFQSEAQFDESVLPQPKTLDDWNRLTLGELHWVKDLYEENSKIIEGLSQEDKVQVFKLYADKGVLIFRMVQSFMQEPDKYPFVRPLIERNPYAQYVLSKEEGPLEDDTTSPPSLNVSAQEVREMDYVKKAFFFMSISSLDQVNEDIRNLIFEDILKNNVVPISEEIFIDLIKNWAKDYPLEREDLTPEDIQELPPESTNLYLAIMIARDGAFSKLSAEKQEAFKEKFLEINEKMMTQMLKETALTEERISSLDTSLLTILCNILPANPNLLVYQPPITTLIRRINNEGISSWDSSLQKFDDIALTELNKETSISYFRALIFGRSFEYYVSSNGLKKTVFKNKLVELGAGEEFLNKLSVSLIKKLKGEPLGMLCLTLIRKPDLLTTLPTEKKNALFDLFKANNTWNDDFITNNITVENIQQFPLEMVKQWHSINHWFLDEEKKAALTRKIEEAGLE